MPKRSTLHTFLVYTISATLLMTVHTLMATALESGNPRLTVFVQSKYVDKSLYASAAILDRISLFNRKLENIHTI